MDLFERMLGEGVQRNTITHSVDRVSNEWQQAVDLFERMLGEGVQQNIITTTDILQFLISFQKGIRPAISAIKKSVFR